MSLRIGVDVGGTNTDAVLVDEDDTVVASVKRPTTDDIASGVADVVGALVADGDPTRVRLAMLGTTQCTNALVQRRGLRRVGLIRIGAPATTAVPPLADWPVDLRDAVLHDAAVVGGGHHYDGREIAPLDRTVIADLARGWRGMVEAVAVSAVFSPVSAAHEQVAADLLREVLDVPVSVSHEIGSLGLLERENATVMNATLTGVAETAAAGFRSALTRCGIRAGAYLSQNDGTLMTLDEAARRPVLTVASGPTNSLRGGARLSGVTDGIVIDVGGTTADLGVLAAGFPRESAVAVEVGGVTTNFRMPDLVSVALGGGTVVRDRDGEVRLGPDSVGHAITREALCFGGGTVTLTDVAVVLGHTLGDAAAARRGLAPEVAARARAACHARLAGALDRIKTRAGAVPVVAVGGGSFLVPDDLAGALEVRRPQHHEVANAIGAAIAEVSGEVDAVFRFADSSREQVLAQARDTARRRAVAAGADPEAVREVDLEEVALAYLPGDAVRVRVRVVGPLRVGARADASSTGTARP